MKTHSFAPWVMALSLMTMATSPVHAQQADNKAAPSPAVTNATDAGTTEATRWLGLIDGGQYGNGWTEAATSFRAAVGQPDWIQSLNQVRRPLGAATTRTLKSAALTHQLPNMPAGDYVIIQFDTAFEQHPKAVETVVVQRDTDQAWRVTGYFIK